MAQKYWITSEQRSYAIDKYSVLLSMIDKGELRYSRNALSGDLKNFRVHSFFVAHIYMFWFIGIASSFITFSVSGIIFIALYLMSAKGYHNYYDLIRKNFPAVLGLTNSTSPSTEKNIDAKGYVGEKILSNDGYKIYLSKKFNIKKNDLFNKFEVNEKLFDTLDDALNYADEKEGGKKKKEEIISSDLIQGDDEKINDSTKYADEALKYNITFDGEKYLYKTYRYDNLSDAVAYAKYQNKGK